MYQNILVPTDGSKLSMKAVKTAVRLASALGARVTGVYCIPTFSDPIYTEGLSVAGPSAGRQRAEAKKAGSKALAEIEKSARAAGVACGSAILASGTPWEGILKTAKSRRSDLIVMASHGRRGISALLLGSETVKVLTHSTIPVLVYR